MTADEASVSREIRIFALMTILPILLGTAAGVWFARTALQKMRDDELRDLEAHAEAWARSAVIRRHGAPLRPPPSRRPPLR